MGEEREWGARRSLPQSHGSCFMNVYLHAHSAGCHLIQMRGEAFAPGAEGHTFPLSSRPSSTNTGPLGTGGQDLPPALQLQIKHSLTPGFSTEAVLVHDGTRSSTWRRGR